jgi:hypothetical protein
MGRVAAAEQGNDVMCDCNERRLPSTPDGPNYLAIAPFVIAPVLVAIEFILHYGFDIPCFGGGAYP